MREKERKKEWEREKKERKREKGERESDKAKEDKKTNTKSEEKILPRYPLDFAATLLDVFDELDISPSLLHIRRAEAGSGEIIVGEKG